MTEHEPNVDSTPAVSEPAPGAPSEDAAPGTPGEDAAPRRRGSARSLRPPLVDYKDVETLRKFLTSSSKIMSRKRAGTTTQEQRALKLAVKRARFLALIPYSGF